MTFEELTELIAAQRSQGEGCQECYTAITRESLKPTSEIVGDLSARNALTTYQIRQHTTQEAGIKTWGFAATLQNLAVRPSKERLHVWALDNNDKLFIVLISASKELVGCIGVEKRNKWFMSKETLFALVVSQRDEGEGYQVFYEAFVAGSLQNPGRLPEPMTVATALATLQQKQQTAIGQNLPIWGFDTTLQHFAIRPADETIIMWFLVAGDKVLRVFTSEAKEAVGCVAWDAGPNNAWKAD